MARNALAALLACVLLPPVAAAEPVILRSVPDVIVRVGDDCHHVFPPGGSQPCCLGPPGVECPHLPMDLVQRLLESRIVIGGLP